MANDKILPKGGESAAKAPEELGVVVFITG